MNPLHCLALALSFCSLALSTSSAEQPQPQLRLVGDAGSPQAVYLITFDTPMVDEDAIGTETKRIPYRIEPRLQTAFTWRSQRSGEIRITETPHQSMNYRVLAAGGMRDLAGDRQTPGEFGTIQMPAPKLLHRRYSGTTRMPAFLLQFDAPVTASAAAEAFRFESASGLHLEAKGRTATRQDFEAHRVTAPAPTWEETWAGKTSKVGRKRASALILEPVRLLPPVGRWNLVQAADLKTKSGHPAVQVENGLRPVRLAEILRPKVRDVRPYNPFDAGLQIIVDFTKGLDSSVEAEAMAAAVRVTPEIANQKIIFRGGGLTIQGDFEYDEPYQVILGPGLRARDGTELGFTVSRTVTFRPNSGYLALPAFEKTQASAGARKFRTVSANLEQVRIRVKSIPAAELVDALAAYRLYQRTDKDSGARQFVDFEAIPGKLVHDETRSTTAAIDQSEAIEMNWTEVLGEETPAALFVFADGIERSDLGRNPGTVVAESLVQLTDLGLVFKQGIHGDLAYGFSMRTGRPVEGLVVTQFNGDRKKIGSARTDADGIARLEHLPDARWVLARKGADQHAITLADRAQSVPTWRLGVPYSDRGFEKAERRSFLFTDRPVYRPGDVVHFKGYTRIQQGEELQMPPSPSTVKMLLRDPKRKTLLTRELAINEHGSFDLDLPISGETLGRHVIEIRFPSENGMVSRSTSVSFLVEEYRPNSFEITLDEAEALKEGERLSFPLAARYFMGQNLSKAKLTWSASVELVPVHAAGFEQYHFGDYGSESVRYYGGSESEIYQSGEGELDQTGMVTTTVPIPAPAKGTAAPQRIRFSAEVTDVNQQTIAASRTAYVPGSSFYLGLRKTDGFATAGKAVEFAMVAVAEDGSPHHSPVDAELKIEKIVVNVIKVKAAGGGVTHQNLESLVSVLEQPVKLNSKGAPPAAAASATGSFVPAEAGRYVVTLSATDAEGRPVRTRSEFWCYGGSGWSWQYRDGSQINLRPDKDSYAPGEVARIAVETPIAGHALVTLERSGISRSFTQQISPEQPLIEIPVTEADSPNVFVSVVLIRGSKDSAARFPRTDSRVGACQLRVKGNPSLKVTVSSSASRVLPKDPVEVVAEVTDADGKALSGAEVVLYAVDEGVLSLTGSETPDPASVMHRPHLLATKTQLSVLDLFEEDPSRQMVGNKGILVGGGGEDSEDPAGFDPSQLREDFKACALWEANLITDANGRVKTSFKAPDNLTRFRIIAVAAAGPAGFASAEGEVTVHKPLMVEPAVPRFGNLGDEVILSAILHNTSKHAGEFMVRLELDETAAFVGREEKGRVRPVVDTALSADPSRTRRMHLKAGETHSVSWPVRFIHEGEAEWLWSAEALDLEPGSRLARELKDQVQSGLTVHLPVPRFREVHFAKLENDQDVTELMRSLNPEILEGEGLLRIELANTRLLEGAEALGQILRYPYGCAEQSTSSTMPWLEMSRFAPALPALQGRFEERDASIRAGVGRLLSMQTRDGGLGYWPGATTTNPWATAYGGLGLVRASEEGEFVPRETLKAILDALARQVRASSDKSSYHHRSDRTLGLYVLARAGRPDRGTQNRLYQDRDSLGPIERSFLAMAMSRSGSNAEVTLPLLVNPEKAVSERHWVGDRYRKAVQSLALSTIAPESPEAVKAIDTLVESRNARGHWGSTYCNAWALFALAEASLHERAMPSKGEFTWQEDRLPYSLRPNHAGSAALEIDFQKREIAPQLTITPGAPIYARVELEGRPRIRPMPARSQGCSVQRTYEELHPDGSTSKADQLEIGDLVLVTLDVDCSRGDRYLVLDDPLPAILEAVNPEFETSAAPGQFDKTTGRSRWSSDRREMRDERVLFFRNYLPAGGEFQTRYLARVVSEGAATAPPAKLEAMYDPGFFGSCASSILRAGADPVAREKKVAVHGSR